MTREELLNAPEYWIAKLCLQFNRFIIEHTGEGKKISIEEFGLSKNSIKKLMEYDYDPKLSKLVELAMKCGYVPRFDFVPIDTVIKEDSSGLMEDSSGLMSVDELFKRLPSHIGRNKLLNDDGKVVGYVSDDKDGLDIGWFTLHNDGKDWKTCYGTDEVAVCMNPDSETGPYDNAICYGKTPRESMQEMYNWCVKHGFVKED